MDLEELEKTVSQLRNSIQLQDKILISRTHEKLGSRVKLPVGYAEQYNVSGEVLLGDDCTVIPDGKGGNLLFAAEGIVNHFLEDDPWFAGYSAIVVNISDIYAMGGLPIAVTDVIYGKDKAALEEIWDGMLAASSAYDVPIVGGHTCYRTEAKALAVSILGRADNLLSSFSAKPGQKLMMAVDMDGSYYGSYPFWNASTSSSSDKLRETGTILQTIAVKGLSSCAKDISMGGLLGTIAMLGNTSEVGFDIYFDQIIEPEDGDWKRWLLAFPSFGFILTCEQNNTEKMQKIFHDQKIPCQEIGAVKEELGIRLLKDGEQIDFL